MKSREGTRKANGGGTRKINLNMYRGRTGFAAEENISLGLGRGAFKKRKEERKEKKSVF